MSPTETNSPLATRSSGCDAESNGGRPIEENRSEALPAHIYGPDTMDPCRLRLDESSQSTIRQLKRDYDAKSHTIRQSRNPTYPDMQGSLVLSTIENLKALIDYCGIDLKYNVINQRIEVKAARVSPGEEESDVKAILISEAAKHGLPKGAVNDLLDHIIRMNPINPVTQCLDRLTASEEIDPISRLVRHCQMEDTDWAEICLSRWLIQAVAAADNGERSPNRAARPEFPYVLVLVGEQGTAKTSFINFLLPDETKQYFSSGFVLDVKAKDSVMTATSNWIVELGELDATLRRSDVSALKAFLTSPIDVYRKPYAKGASRVPRRTCYMASVNETKFLVDPTGNRRFWPIKVSSKITPIPMALVEEVWAWAWRQYQEGAQWWLTPDEERAHSLVVSGFESKPLKESLLDCYDFQSAERPLVLTGTQILAEIGAEACGSNSTKLGLIFSRDLKVERSGRTYKMPPRTSANRHTL